MPLGYSEFAQNWLWGLGMSVFEMSIFRPQCAFRSFGYFTKWITQWSLFFIMMAILCLILLIYCHKHRNAHHDWRYISKKQGLLTTVAAAQMLLMLVHLRDDLIFVQCVRCEDSKLCISLCFHLLFMAIHLNYTILYSISLFLLYVYHFLYVFLL